MMVIEPKTETTMKLLQILTVLVMPFAAISCTAVVDPDGDRPSSTTMTTTTAGVPYATGGVTTTTTR